MFESPSIAAPTAVATTCVAPHPPIVGAYETPDRKRQFVSTIFDETAQDYDRVERWLSLGSGRWYRGRALVRAGLKPGMNTVDVAVGTGLVAGEAMKIIAPGGRLIGVDPSLQMMRRAKERLGIEAVLGRAESLPFADAGFDFLSMGYALRHVEDLNAAFSEFHRVLRPGGRACVLEVTRPRSAIGRALLRAYLSTLSFTVGLFGGLAPRTPELWAYYWQTIDKCVSPQEVMDALTRAGFKDVARNVVGGVFSEYTATRA